MQDVAPSQADLEALASRHGIRLIVQFGSTVSGVVHARSDVDVGVLLSSVAVSLRTLAEIQHGLQGLFPDRPVDVAMINRADPLFLKKMLESCRLLYGDPREFQRLRLSAFKRYQDHRRFLELERRSVERRLARYRTSS